LGLFFLPILQVILDSLFVEIGGLPLFDHQRARGTFSDTSPEPVTVDVFHQACFSIDQLKRSFRARGDAFSTTIALAFIDSDDISDSHLSSGFSDANFFRDNPKIRDREGKLP
jgi:hypothetical protein